jgi:signal transduction histidine kinase
MPAQRPPETEAADLVGHELRTPLTLIRGYAEALRDEGCELSSDQRAWVEAILRGAERLQRAVERIEGELRDA